MRPYSVGAPGALRPAPAAFDDSSRSSHPRSNRGDPIDLIAWSFPSGFLTRSMARMLPQDLPGPPFLPQVFFRTRPSRGRSAPHMMLVSSSRFEAAMREEIIFSRSLTNAFIRIGTACC